MNLKDNPFVKPISEFGDLKGNPKNSRKGFPKTFSSILVLIIISGIIAGYFLINSNEEEVSSSDNGLQENSSLPLDILDNFNKIEEMHFEEVPIRYYLDVNSSFTYAPYFGAKNITINGNDKYKEKRILNAIKIIEEETKDLITFERVNSTEDAKILIYGLPPLAEEGFFIIEGEAGPIEFSDNQIGYSQVNFYSTDMGGYTAWNYGQCSNFPTVEIHEILHAFGLGHIYDSDSRIMYPLKLTYKNCKINEIDNETIYCLKKIYSNGNISGDCSKLGIYPYQLSKEEIERLEKQNSFEDFTWDSNFPISYSIFDCEEYERKRINSAVGQFEKDINKDFLVLNENRNSKINFFCKKTDEEVFNFETDYWKHNNYPAINKHYSFGNNNQIVQANISLFGYSYCEDSPLSNAQLEMLAILRAIGLRNNYGGIMSPPKVDYTYNSCTLQNSLGSFTTHKIKEMYNFN